MAIRHNTAYLKELVAYWMEVYDWRKQERAINAYPPFRTETDGVPIHFIHVRGKGPNPKPLIDQLSSMHARNQGMTCVACG